MTVQIIALAAAIAYAMSFVLSKRGMRYSTPITITFVSLLMQTLVLFAVVFFFTDIRRPRRLSIFSSSLPASCKWPCAN